MTSKNPHRVRFGPFEADLDTHELWKNGLRVKLGGQPFEILALLLSRAGQMVTREELQKELWAADTFVDFNHGLNAAVNKLRETLADSADQPRYIETLPRRGYRFVGKIGGADESVAVAATGSAFVPPTSTAPPPSLAAEPLPQSDAAVGETATRWFHSRLIRTAVIAGAVATIVYWIVLPGWHEVRKAIVKEGIEKAESMLRGEESARIFTLVPDPASDPAISPDGKLVAFRRNSDAPDGAGIFVTSSEGKGVAQLTQHPGDCCPAWSPDGTQLAFTRIAADEYGIYIVSAKGGAPRKISHDDPRKKRGELAWTPDGKAIAFSGDSPRGGSQIFLISVGDSRVIPVTEPQGQDRDWGPAFSPDGKEMAFVRGNGAGFPEEVFVMDVGGAGARQLTNERAAIMGPPTWSQDGASVIFSSTKSGDPALWTIPASGGTAARIAGTGSATWHPAVAKESGQMAAQKILRSSGVYCLAVEREPGKNSPSVITATSGRNEGPQLSPDGRRLVFMSDRSGEVEIWVSNRDGSSQTQLTNVHGAGTPTWSPDGSWIAFDSPSRDANGGVGLSSIWIVSATGGAPRSLVRDQFENVVPSWSHDGKWVYFASSRSGTDQVWKVPADGGTPVQVTRGGGFAALESVDGTTLYFAKTRYDNPELWQMPVAGGLEFRFPGVLRPRSWAAWSPTSRGIFFVPEENASGGTSIDFYDFQTRLVRQISLLDRTPFWLSASPDGKEVFFNQAERDESSIVLVKAK